MSDPRPHLDLGPPTQHPFLNPRRGSSESEPVPPRNRAAHAAAIREQLDSLARSWETTDERLPESRGHLAAAEAAPGAELAVSSLGDKRSEVAVVEATDQTALLHVRNDDLRALRLKVNAYAERDTSKGRPSNEALVAPLQTVRDATYADLVVGEFAAQQIDAAAHYWVELWTDGGRLGSPETQSRIRAVVETLATMSDDNAPEPVTFRGTERDIHLVRLSGAVLLDLPRLAPDVYRVARPADGRADRLARDYVGDLILGHDVVPPGPEAAVVAILDTGVAEEHPLLAPLIAYDGISVVPGELSAIDADGHGSEMAGVAGYRDLADALIASAPIVARAHLENIRCHATGGTPPLWASRTEAAVEAAESLGERRRVFNLALSDPANTTATRTSWSASIDRLAHNDERGRLVCVPMGNANELLNPDDYPVHNMAAFVHDPAHAVNAITVGAVTHRDELSDDPLLGTLRPVARRGQLSPYTSTNPSVGLPIKPDVVMEGGNACPDGAIMNSGEPDLSVLTVDHRHGVGKLLAWTWATSAACAATSGLLAEIWTANLSRSAQTIRALLVNSARWTPEICAQHPERKERLRAVGYGEPQPDVALASTAQCPTLILEQALAPNARVESAARGMHLVQLPLPDEELLALGAHPVRLAVTLSYFGEPNEARRTQYFGASLGWDLQRRGETADEFVRRVNDSWRPPGTPRPEAAAPWDWEIGRDARSRGTVQSDRLVTDAASLAGEKLIAVWPTRGWWSDHPTTRMDAKIGYSLVVTIDAGDAEIDLYALMSIPVDLPGSVDLEVR